MIFPLINGAGPSGSRTLFGPIEYVEVRGLAAGTYDVSIYAYDQSGNAGSSASATGLEVEAAQDPAPPNFQTNLFHDPTYVSTDNNSNSANGSGCFLKQLGLFGAD